MHAVPSHIRENVVRIDVGQTKTFLREPGNPGLDRVLTLYVAKAYGTVSVLVGEYGLNGTERMTTIHLGPHGAARMRVHGSLVLMATAQLADVEELVFSILEPDSRADVSPIPPCNENVICVAGGAVAPWQDVGLLAGWSPAGRYTFGLYTDGTTEFRFTDASGVPTWGTWTVNGEAGIPRLHPPHYKLQARCTAAIGAPDVHVLAVWR